MMRKVGFAVAIAAVLLLLAGSARAGEDEVIMKTGMVLKGKILERTETGLRIHVIGLGKMNITWDRIQSVNGEDVEPGEPAVPEPVPANPGDSEEKKPPDESGAPEEEPADPKPTEKLPPSRVDVPYGEMKKGQTLLFIFKGKDHGDWRDSGLRVIAEVGVVGKKRLKIITDPGAGVLGERWVRRGDLVRAVDLGDSPERRLLFFSDGVASGSWVRGTTADGRSFEGQLGGVTAEGTMTVWSPVEDRLDKVEISLVALRTLSAIVRSRDLHHRLEGLLPGEPVRISVFGRESPISGRVKAFDRRWLTLATGEDGTEEVLVYRGLPITALTTLPETVRGALENITKETWLTVDVRTEDDETVTRRSVTGQFVSVSLETITLETPDGLEGIDAGTVRGIVRPAPETLPSLTARLEESSAETILPVRPGMSRREVEKRLPVGVKGIDLLYDGDVVSTVYCRPPFPGPVFGIPLGARLTDALTRTDLVFDVQIDPKNPDGEPVTTMVSRTLKTLLVKLLVSKSGEVLAAEISKR